MAITPNWQNEIAALFAEPYWIDEGDRTQTGQGWIGCMNGYALQLDDYSSIKASSVLIYDVLSSRMMPLGEASWPDEPLEIFRQWVNLGWPETAFSPVDPKERIAPPSERPLQIRIRRDIRSLSQAELDDYRMRLDDVMELWNTAPSSPGQIFAAVHGEWCLHYQEAFLFWHRAYLMRFEQELGCAVPYWNWYALGASIDGNPASGLPQAFKDDTYIHPRTGETRPNPLKYAAARDGHSKLCAGGPSAGATSAGLVDCRFVQRDSILYTSGDDHRAEREKKIGLVALYQQQVARALAFTDFSEPQGAGFPWANILTFDPPPPDSEYIYRNYNFDGAYEQPHDNFHGWVGPDMADNSYTAYDPVFWSYHANIDRIYEVWLRANPQATYTAGFAIHPFAGPRAERFEFTDRRQFIYTTIGDLARDSRGLGYDFGPPVDPDFGSKTASSETGAAAAAGAPVCPHRKAPAATLAAAQLPASELLVIFDGVRCTHDSYAIDVFLNQEAPTPADVSAQNPHYVGRMTRLGMGQEDTRGRCITVGVPRILDATGAAEALGIPGGTEVSCTMVVSALADGRVLAPADYASLPGFLPRLVWSDRGWASKAPDRPEPVSACCSAKSA